MKSLFVFLVFVSSLNIFPCKSSATIINIAEFDVSAYAESSGLDVFGPDNQTGYFSIGIGDFDYFTMFEVHSNDIGHKLSYWSGPSILPGVDSGDYFIRTITGYDFTYEEARAFGTQIPMIYGYNSGSAIHHQIVLNPRLDDYILHGIYLDVVDISTGGTPEVYTRLYADAEVVPEPSTFILFAAGVVGIILMRKKVEGVKLTSGPRLRC